MSDARSAEYVLAGWVCDDSDHDTYCDFDFVRADRPDRAGPPVCASHPDAKWIAVYALNDGDVA